MGGSIAAGDALVVGQKQPQMQAPFWDDGIRKPEQ